MGEFLKLLAEIGLALDAAEQAAGAGEVGEATDALERAETDLSTLRSQWPDMRSGERAIVGAAASPLRARLDALRTSLPTRTALSEGAPERDPEEELDPAAAPLTSSA